MDHHQILPLVDIPLPLLKAIPIIFEQLTTHYQILQT